MNTLKSLKKGKLFLMIMSIALLTSCAKYKKYDNKELIEDTYTGTIYITSGGEDPAGDFTGSGDAGSYSFAWENPQDRASANFDITTNTGSVQMIIQDKKGKEVLNETINGADNIDSFSGVSEEGKSGTWKVTIILTDFNGDGSYSIHPGN